MIVIAGPPPGRLGNRLVLFASFIAAAAEHGFSVLNPTFAPYARYFRGPAHDLLCRYPARRLTPVPGARVALERIAMRGGDELARWEQRRRRDGRVVTLDPSERLDLNSEEFLHVVRRYRVVVARGWAFRNADNCARHRDIVRAYFEPLDHYLTRGRSMTEAARADGRLLVGVHLRRGDYEHFKGGRLYYSHEQYAQIMQGIEAAFPDRDVSFLVCSDEPVPPDPFGALDVRPVEGTELEDLYTLAACDLIAGPQSTFSGWASYYGDVPRYVIKDPDAVPTRESFKVHYGLGWGARGLRDWTANRTQDRAGQEAPTESAAGPTGPRERTA
jgi:hypothetical protein